jgi:RNA polymerase sigma factor (sigma-70 family)
MGATHDADNDDRGRAQPSRAVGDAYQRYGPALMRKAERILQNRDDAGDIVQGVFVDLMGRRRAEFELAYLYRAVTTRCLNFIRDARNRQRLLDHQQPALRGPVRTRCDDELLGLDLLVKLVTKLDRGSQEVLICRFWDDMTQEEIASHLGVSRRTVGKRLAKIRRSVDTLGGQQ